MCPHSVCVPTTLTAALSHPTLPPDVRADPEPHWPQLPGPGCIFPTTIPLSSSDIPRARVLSWASAIFSQLYIHATGSPDPHWLPFKAPHPRTSPADRAMSSPPPQVLPPADLALFGQVSLGLSHCRIHGFLSWKTKAQTSPGFEGRSTPQTPEVPVLFSKV